MAHEWLADELHVVLCQIGKQSHVRKTRLYQLLINVSLKIEVVNLVI